MRERWGILSPMPGMDDAWVRVNRAKANYARLKGEIAEFWRDHPDMATVGVEHDGKGNVRLVARIGTRPPHDWGLASGDILVDLRCALDYAVYALAIRHGGIDPPNSADKLEFPICDTDTRWAEAIGRHKLDGLSDEAIRWIDAQQPYQRGNGGPTSFLRVLEELVGINKHRFVYVAWCKLESLTLPMSGEGFRIEDFVAFQIPGELEDGTVLATFRLVATQPKAQIQLKPSLTTYIAIEPTTKGWLDLAATLSGFVGTIERYIREMEALP